MKLLSRMFLGLVIILAMLINSCANDAKTDNSHAADSLVVENNEHERDSESPEGSGGEEAGTEFTLNEQYDNTRNGVRLVLAYNAENSSFDGTIENTTDESLEKVRVEVHLSSGVELGPTPPVNLAAGEKRDVRLIAEGNKFERWTAHPEVGVNEHGHGEGGEHGDGEGGGEHGGDESHGEH